MAVCEILEHLLIDPDRAVGEMARIVKPGGFLVISTPNATRLPKLYAMALGRNVYDWYSPYGPYGRHNREYTLSEVIELMGRHGFEAAHVDVRNVEPLARRFTYLQWLRPKAWYGHCSWLAGGFDRYAPARRRLVPASAVSVVALDTSLPAAHRTSRAASRRIASNQHETAARAPGAGLEALDNGILSCDDPATVQRICNELSAEKIERLFRKWLRYRTPSRAKIALAASDTSFRYCRRNSR